LTWFGNEVEGVFRQVEGQVSSQHDVSDENEHSGASEDDVEGDVET
jgi:hypothetical protein